MTEMMNVNPLMDYARKTECSVKIPSQGLWYDDDNIQFNSIGEVDIMPMLPNDEMKIVNPESLISGDAIISLIKSCCPGIKRPEELYYPDVNTLLLGIRKATYGDEIEQNYICPICWSKKNDIEMEEMTRLIKERGADGHTLSIEEGKEIRKEVESNVAPKITEMERNNKILITPQTIKINIDSILNTITFLPENPYVETKEGLKIYVAPYKCVDKIKFTTQQIKYQKIARFYENENNNLDITDESQLTPELMEKLSKVGDMYTDITSSALDLISLCILKIELPNKEIVDNKDFIYEYIKNCDVDLINKLKNKIEELNGYGIKQSIACSCGCCGHEWEEKFYGFNQSDFFGISS